MSNPFCIMSFIASRVGDSLSVNTRNVTSIMIPRSLNGICILTSPCASLRPPTPLTFFPRNGLTALVKLNRLQYAVYWLSEIMDLRFAPVSILMPLKLILLVPCVCISLLCVAYVESLSCMFLEIVASMLEYCRFFCMVSFLSLAVNDLSYCKIVLLRDDVSKLGSIFSFGTFCFPNWMLIGLLVSPSSMDVYP